jgi:transcriptional regulator with XRE-family HTH domain
MLRALRTSAFPIEGPISRPQNEGMDPDQLQHFAELLRVGRAKLRMNRLAFCRAVGISANTLRALERASQQPEARTVEKIAQVLGMTSSALTHGKRGVDPGDPLLVNLNDEDLEVAQAFHHAPVRVRQEVLGALQQRGRRSGPGISRAASEWIDRLLRLPSTQREAIAELIAEFESGRAESTEVVDEPGPPVKRPQRKVGT